jgi:hypothetical protein
MAPILADIFMEYSEQQLEKFKDTHKIKFLSKIRGRHGTFINLNEKQSDIEKLLKYVNSLHLNLKFTNEIEEDSGLSFLDVKVIKQRTKFENTYRSIIKLV